jgi:hypothetical protein
MPREPVSRGEESLRHRDKGPSLPDPSQLVLLGSWDGGGSEEELVEAWVGERGSVPCVVPSLRFYLASM